METPISDAAKAAAKACESAMSRAMKAAAEQGHADYDFEPIIQRAIDQSHAEKDQRIAELTIERDDNAKWRAELSRQVQEVLIERDATQAALREAQERLAEDNKQLGPWRLIRGDQWQCSECHNFVMRGTYPTHFGHAHNCSYSAQPIITRAETAEASVAVKDAALSDFLVAWDGGSGGKALNGYIVRLRLVCDALTPSPGQAIAQDGWRDISTAPDKSDESTPFLVLLPGNDVADFIAQQVTWFQGDMYPDAMNGLIDYSDRITSATHWMPIPPAPEAPTEGAR